MTEFLQYIRDVRRYSQRTVEIYQAVLTEFTAFMDGAPMSAAAIRAYEIHLLQDRKLKAKTVNLHLSVVSSYCRYLVRKGRLNSNPVRVVSRPKVEKRLPEFFRSEAMEEYFRATCGVMEFGSYQEMLARICVSFLFNCGLRRSELISLNRSSLDLSRKVLHVKGKGEKMREIPLNDVFCKEISLYLQKLSSLKECNADLNSPLVQTPTGSRLYPMYVERIVKQELGSSMSTTAKKSPHVLRHTIATELLDGGADLNSIKEFLGHSSLAATQVYTHNSIERLKTVYNNAHPRAKSGGKNGNYD